MKFIAKYLLLLFLISPFLSKAQQIAGGEITYTCAGNDTYNIRLVIYSKCPSPTPPEFKINYFSNSVNQAPKSANLKAAEREIIKSCEGKPSLCDNVTGSAPDAIIKQAYTGSIKLDQKLKDWIVELQTTNRTNINTVSNNDRMYLAATINNTGTLCNSSATFQSTPLFFSNADQAVTFDPNIGNPDGDKQTVALIAPKVTALSVLNYSAPYSITQPIKTTGPFGFDPNTGKISYTAAADGERSTIAMQVTETRNGVVIGTVMREMFIQTQPKQTLPYFLGSDTIKFCQGDNININYSGKTDLAGTNVDIIWANPADWNVSKSDSGSKYKIFKTPSAASFVFNPTTLFTGAKRMDLILIDDKCGKVVKSVFVKIYPKPSISNPNFTDSNVTCINKPFPITVLATGGTKPYKYSWTGFSETSNSLSVSSVGTYRAIVTDANNCSAIFVKNIKSPINFETGKILCINTPLTFYDISGVSFPNYTPPPAVPLFKDGKTKYKWTFGDATKDDTSSTPVHSFQKAGKYSVTMEITRTDNGQTCKNAITKTVKIFENPLLTFSAIDTCVQTERSDLKVLDKVTKQPNDTSISNINIVYSVDGIIRTSAYLNRFPTSLYVRKAGSYVVKVNVKNDAGCISELTKTLIVREKPTILQSPRKNFFYRCDLPGFPDTVLTFKATSVTDALVKNPFLNVTIRRTGATSDSTIPDYTPETPIKVPVKLVLNTDNYIDILTKDAFGCTNDTTIKIADPVNPVISLDKYYCFSKDTLKLIDDSLKNLYHWGIENSVWDMKDGETETTNGFASHVYTFDPLDEAKVLLTVTDKKKCTDTTSFRVYLSEPDTSQFKIIDPLACFADTVRIISIKNKYINSWYFRYKDKPDSIYSKPDALVLNKNFGKTFPAHLDTVQFYTSNKYLATTSIFYNEPDTTLNFDRSKPLKTLAKVCYYKISREWKIIPRLQYKILDNYNHCFDSTKSFHADFLIKPDSTLRLDTLSFKWSLYNPSNKIIDSLVTKQNGDLSYNPDKALFTEIATTRRNYNSSPNPAERYLPYQLYVKYQYTDGNITCNESAKIPVGNEKVNFVIDKSPDVTCLNYTRSYYLKQIRFLDLIQVDTGVVSELNNTVWDFGDSTKVIEDYPRRRYSKPGNYLVNAYGTNYYGCKFQNDFNLLVKPSPIARLKIDPVCLGNASVMDASASTPSIPSSYITDYYWFFGDKIPKRVDPTSVQPPKIIADSTEPDSLLAVKVSSNPIFTNTFRQGSFPVGLVVRDSNGCYGETQVIQAIVNKVPSVDFSIVAKNTQDQDYLGNEPIQFIEQSANVDYWKWSLGDGSIQESPAGSPSFNIEHTYPYYAPPFPKEKNIYDISLFVKTKEGCIDSVKKTIDVNAYFELPNAFSPNEDGLHDLLLGVGKGIKEIKEFKIFNRWGEVIHSVTGVPEKDALRRGYLLWDGSYNGQIQPVGSYVYYAVVKTGYGNDLIRKGNLTLLR